MLLANHTRDNAFDRLRSGGSDWGVSFLEGMLDLLVLILLVLSGWLIGRFARAIYNRSRRAEPTSGSILMGKTMVIVAVVGMAGFALTRVYDMNLVSLFATLGIVSLALGFGLQNTVANLAAGVALSFDRPFQVGDRIRVGSTWGDVITIGLRSTRIRTTSGEVVAVPNAVLDTQEVWNNTDSAQTGLRLEIPIGISYQSSIPLAESCVLSVARKHRKIQAFPEPVVQVKGFGDNSIDLELRAWIAEARDKARVEDQLLRGIKHEFDAQGVHFPFPQRTVSYLNDLDQPAETPEHLIGEHATRPAVLVCTRDVSSAKLMGHKVVDFVKRLEARLVVLHVRPRTQAFKTSDAEAALNHYLAMAAQAGVPARARSEIGDLVEQMLVVAKEEGVRLVIFGQSKSRMSWLRHEVSDAAKASPAPVLPLQVDVNLDDAFVTRWRKKIEEPQGER